CYGKIIGNEIANNITVDSGGGIYQGSGDILRNIIMNNEAAFNGGAIFGSSATIAYNTIIGNKAGNLGGAISGSNGVVGRNIIAGNRAVFGSGIGSCGAMIHNNTITGNRVEESGTLYQCFNAVENNIVAFNEGPPDLGGIFGVSVNTYNCFWENNGLDFSGGASQGENDLIDDPLFARTGHWDDNGTAADTNDDFWVDGDYHVLSEYGRWNPATQRWVYDGQTSPCIDAGFVFWEWRGEYWPHGARINQGRYGGTAEASMSSNDIGNVADLDLDGLVDFNDLMLLCEVWPYDLPLLREDLNRNGFVDLPDYAILIANWAPFPLPSPSPMTWEVEPYELQVGIVTMKAGEAQASDGGGVEYLFEIESGGVFSYSGWLSQQTYTRADLSAGVEYCFRVKARNAENHVESQISDPPVCIIVSSPPTPSPTTWAKPPNADAFDSVSMMAAPATSTDGSGVEYYFDCVSEGEGGHDRDWADSNDYTDIVSEDREYCYRVKARNKGNLLETEWSEERCATTPMAPPPTPNPMIWESEPMALTHTSITMTAGEATSADGIPPEYFFWNVTMDPIPDVNNDSLWQTSRLFVDTGLTKLTTYTYKVAARNAYNKLPTEWSDPRSATTPCDDHQSPWFPDGIYWDAPPCECNHDTSSNFYWYAEMRAAEAEDDSGDPLQYRFLCYDGDDLESEFTSNWQENRCWKVWLRGRQLQGYSFAVAVRDSCGNRIESPKVLLWRCYPYPSEACRPDVCDY
ncbi:MAG: right-handed parallel beta-helix repeat-containing protein, partial [Planctomycetota bacterium]